MDDVCTHCNTSKNSNGFTLVELSLVIVIIGLIIAGITAGNSLIRQAKLRTILTDIDKYKTALNAFKLQYNGLPGDLISASRYWGASCDATTSNCDGNGDRIIDNPNSTTDNESIRAWQHLALAKLIPGTYTGQGVVAGGSLATIRFSVNAPISSITNTGFSISGSGAWGTTGNLFQYGKQAPGYWASYSAVTPQEAFNLDMKTDNGTANTGTLYTIRGDEYYTIAGRCVDKDYNAPAPVSYILSDSSVSCRLFFWIK